MVKRLSVQELNKVSHGREIWCFGCGKRLNEMLALYKEESFVENVTKLIDNNKSIHGKIKRVGRKQVCITGADVIRKSSLCNMILLITSDSYKAIYEEVKEELAAHMADCYAYPLYYYSMASRLMRLFCRFPVRKQLIFAAGNEPHENADAIVRYLSQEYKGRRYKVIYLTDGEAEENRPVSCLDKNLIRRKANIMRVMQYCWLYAGTSCLLYENEPIVKVRPEQKLIYMNHGTIPLKYVSDVLGQPEEVDYALCPSRQCASLYEEQYHLEPKKQLYIMPPRIQTLLYHRESIEQVVPLRGRQVIIWLPTFRQLRGTDRRDSDVTETFSILNPPGSFARLDRKLEENRKLLVIKPHPREKTDEQIPDCCSHIKLLTEDELKGKNLALHEILGSTAALITDYSGIAFEYMLLDKPICYLTADMDEYTRGFSVEFPMDYMPGTKVNDLAELFDFLDEVKNNKDDYRVERERVMKRIYGENIWENGAEKLIEFLDKI